MNKKSVSTFGCLCKIKNLTDGGCVGRLISGILSEAQPRQASDPSGAGG